MLCCPISQQSIGSEYCILPMGCLLAWLSWLVLENHGAETLLESMSREEKRGGHTYVRTYLRSACMLACLFARLLAESVMASRLVGPLFSSLVLDILSSKYVRA